MHRLHEWSHQQHHRGVSHQVHLHAIVRIIETHGSSWDWEYCLIVNFPRSSAFVEPRSLHPPSGDYFAATKRLRVGFATGSRVSCLLKEAGALGGISRNWARIWSCVATRSVDAHVAPPDGRISRLGRHHDEVRLLLSTTSVFEIPQMVNRTPGVW